MPDDKLALVEELCARWSHGDLEGSLALISYDSRWEPSGRFIGSGQTYLGHAGIREFWDVFREPWESISLTPVDAKELDDGRLLTRTKFMGKGLTSGLVTETELFVIWTFADGQVSGYRSFAEEAQALEAAAQ